MKLSIIIPSLGYEPALDGTICEVRDSIPANTYNRSELIIVYTPSDRNHDKHYSLLKKLEEKFPEFVRIVTERKHGYGLAYIRGFTEAKGEYVLTLDADLTYPVIKLPIMLQAADRMNLDFVNTNRLANHHPSAFHWSHGIGNRLLALWMNFLFWTGFKDSMSGMWLIRKDRIKDMDFNSRHWPFSMEIKVEAKLRGLKCGEINIDYRPRKQGFSTINQIHGLKVAIFIFAKRIGLIAPQALR